MVTLRTRALILRTFVLQIEFEIVTIFQVSSERFLKQQQQTRFVIENRDVFCNVEPKLVNIIYRNFWLFKGRY